MTEPIARVSLVTLCVGDLARSTAFYEALGFRRKARKAEGVAFFEAGGVILSLWSAEELAKDAEIAIGDLNEYASMEATVKAGDLNVGAFTGAKTEDSFGLLHRASWSGKGKYKLRANLGAGNLVLRK